MSPSNFWKDKLYKVSAALGVMQPRGTFGDVVERKEQKMNRRVVPKL